MIRVARRLFSSDAPKLASAALDPITHFIFGANTDIGKTVLTAALLRASYEPGSISSSSTHYIKPLQCGGSDESFIRRNAPGLSSAKTLFDWDTPASPHIASRIEDKPVSDEQVLESLNGHLHVLENASATATNEKGASSSSSGGGGNRSSIWIETAGGVLSPSSSSPHNSAPYHARNDDSLGGWGWVTQADLYKSYRDRSSIVLVGDGRLGGISATLASLEATLNRNYRVGGILLLRDDNSSEEDTNKEALQEYVESRASLPSLVDDALRPRTMQSGLFANPEKSIVSLPKLPPEPEPLDEWYASGQVKDQISSFVHDHLFCSYDDEAV
ncbi:unnamed protein product [Pseudo-nitzschia multistriata]|uniref:CobQ/CobB/MinD/ParA nucleotide binding domain-containing protein n=1 Tax=Pseudo-nitzschia multistriata TaxID=183589 RepID=A0A448Z3H1_9STRA|nr:unnamed protein product [Pseudo-nitzschia multistriata]